MKSENADFIKQKAFAKLALVMDRIFNRKMVIFTRNNLWEAVWGFPLLWLVPLFPLLYLIIGKVFMAKLMFANNDCVSCGLCAKMCPNQAIVMKGTKSKRTLLDLSLRGLPALYGVLWQACHRSGSFLGSSFVFCYSCSCYGLANDMAAAGLWDCISDKFLAANAIGLYLCFSSHAACILAFLESGALAHH